MDSINRQIIMDRVAYVYDTMAGAQCMPPGIKKYVRTLQESVGLADEPTGAQEFLHDHGRGV